MTREIFDFPLPFSMATAYHLFLWTRADLCPSLGIRFHVAHERTNIVFPQNNRGANSSRHCRNRRVSSLVLFSKLKRTYSKLPATLYLSLCSTVNGGDNQDKKVNVFELCHAVIGAFCASQIFLPYIMHIHTYTGIGGFLCLISIFNLYDADTNASLACMGGEL